MSDYTTFTLPSGAVVHVQSSQKGPPAPRGKKGGTTEASGLEERAREAWADGVDLVREIAQGVIDKLRPATSSAKEVSVEFGVNISGKTSVILAEGTVGANLKVQIKW